VFTVECSARCSFSNACKSILTFNVTRNVVLIQLYLTFVTKLFQHCIRFICFSKICSLYGWLLDGSLSSRRVNGKYGVFSVQGYNRMIVFSRSSYFCICACLILALHYGSLTWHQTMFTLYGAPFTVHGSLIFARDFVTGEYCVSLLYVCIILFLRNYIPCYNSALKLQFS